MNTTGSESVFGFWFFVFGFSFLVFSSFVRFTVLRQENKNQEPKPGTKNQEPKTKNQKRKTQNGRNSLPHVHSPFHELAGVDSGGSIPVGMCDIAPLQSAMNAVRP
jgi:hypothetical protein